MYRSKNLQGKLMVKGALIFEENLDVSELQSDIYILELHAK